MKRLKINTGRIKSSVEIKNVPYETKFIQRYVNVTEAVFKISSVSTLHFLEWILNNMNENNVFFYNKSVRERFIDEYYNVTNKKYSHSTLDKAMKNLQDVGIVRSCNDTETRIDPNTGEEKVVKTRMQMYYVDYRYYYRGKNQNKRSQMIKDDYLSSQKEDRWKT